MRRARLLAACAFVAAATATATPPLRRYFPSATEIQGDGPGRLLRVGRSGRILLRPVRYRPLADRHAIANGLRCAIVVTDPERVIAIDTVGIGETEALSCDGLAEAGLVIARGRAARIALVYRTRSPNAAGTTPIVVQRGRGGRWAVDDAASARLGQTSSPVTLATMLQALTDMP